MSTPTSQRDERIELRMPADLVIAEHEALSLSPRDWEAFLAALDESDRPRPRLAAAARRYQSAWGRKTPFS